MTLPGKVQGRRAKGEGRNSKGGARLTIFRTSDFGLLSVFGGGRASDLGMEITFATALTNAFGRQDTALTGTRDAQCHSDLTRLIT